MAVPQATTKFDVAAKRIDVFRRDPQNHWVLYDYGPGESVELASLSLNVPVDLILEDTEEPPPEAA